LQHLRAQRAATGRRLPDRDQQFGRLTVLREEPARACLQRGVEVIVVVERRQTTILIAGCARMIRSVAIVPSVPGIRRSITMTSGFAVSASRTASAPFAASPTISMSAADVPTAFGWTSLLVSLGHLAGSALGQVRVAVGLVGPPLLLLAVAIYYARKRLRRARTGDSSPDRLRLPAGGGTGPESAGFRGPVRSCG
jgi:hypothetical protein